MINSVFRTCKNDYPPVFLEKCKYVANEKKMPEYITDNIEIEISSDSDRKDSDEENFNKGNSDEEKFNEEN